MSTADRDYSEKRDFIRMAMNIEAHIFVTGEDAPLSGLCGDLSATGMRLLLDRPLPVGTGVRVVIQSPNGQIPSLDARASVVRCDPSPEADDYQLGLKIEAMT